MASSILVVDDDVPVRSVICDLLKELDYHPVPAANGVEAVVLFDSMGPENFEGVIVDLIMPEMSGRELVENIRKRREDLAIILCTGHPSLLLGRSNCADLGFDALIAKPFMLENFRRTFLSAMQNHMAGGESPAVA